MTSPHQHGAEGAVLTTTSQCEFRAQASSGLPLWAKLFAFHNFQYIIYQSPLSSFGGRFSPSFAHNPALPAPSLGGAGLTVRARSNQKSRSAGERKAALLRCWMRKGVLGCCRAHATPTFAVAWMSRGMLFLPISSASASVAPSV